jgi:hypothetical protein
MSHGGTTEENQVIEDALNGLSVLQKEVIAQHRVERAKRHSPIIGSLQLHSREGSTENLTYRLCHQQTLAGWLDSHYHCFCKRDHVGI